MSDSNNLSKEIITQSKEVLGKAYDDLIAPSAKPLGDIISFLPRTVRVWLSGWEKWIINGEESIARTAEAIKVKIEKIPEENLTEPEPYIAVPAIQQLSYCYDSKELRDMYANLLVASMNIDTKYYVHPSFVDLLKQITPDEAKLLKVLSGGDKFPLIDLNRYNSDNSYNILIHNFTNLADGICDYPDGVCEYVDNLARLGLIELMPMESLSNEKLYDPLINHLTIQKLQTVPLENGQRYDINKRVFSITAFGNAFIKTCVDEAE